MTSHWLSFGLALIALGQSGSSAMVQTAAVAQAAPQRVQPALRPPQSPTYLANQVDKLGAGFNGRVGIAVRSVDEGWSTGWNGDELYPQQSVSKLWVAITALDAVDRGRVRLDDTVTLTRSDLTLFHQPIAAKILGGGHDHDAGRADVSGDHEERQYLQRQAHALGRRSGGGARDDPRQGPGRDPFL